MRLLERWADKQPWRRALPKSFQLPSSLPRTIATQQKHFFHPRFELTAVYDDAHGPRARVVNHHMLLPHEIFASLHESGNSHQLYESLEQAT